MGSLAYIMFTTFFNLVVLALSVIRIAVTVAVVITAYQYGKNRPLKSILKSCSPTAFATGNMQGMLDWIIALALYELPALCIHSILRFLLLIGRRTGAIIDGAKIRKGVSVQKFN